MSDVNSELKNIIEAALLAAGEPLTLERMLSLFPAESRPSKQEIGDALEALEKDYEGRGIELKRTERSYRFQTREKYGEWISRLCDNAHILGAVARAQPLGLPRPAPQWAAAATFAT